MAGMTYECMDVIIAIRNVIKSWRCVGLCINSDIS